jgi:hypothetical protein
MGKDRNKQTHLRATDVKLQYVKRELTQISRDRFMLLKA